MSLWKKLSNYGNHLHKEQQSKKEERIRRKGKRRAKKVKDEET